MNVLSRQVLLLNASYEALGTIKTRRAITLIWKGAAELVVRDEEKIVHSAHSEFPAPSVIRLTCYVADIAGKQRRSSTKKNRILMRDKYRCQYCGVKGGNFDLTVDHLLPRSRGGTTSPENLVAACFACNQRKGDRTPEEARMPLLKNPAALTYGMDRQILGHESEVRREWRKYLFLEDAQEGAA